MKSLVMILFSLILTAGAMAQNGQNKPAAPAQGTTPAGKPLPQAKSQEEFKAYQEAAAKTDAPSTEAAADEFAQKFPESQLRALLFNRAQQMYRDAGNNDKVISVGRKALAVDPNDPIPNVLTGFALVQTAREGDPEREAKLKEGEADAQRALDNVETGMTISPAASADEVQAARTMIRVMAYETLGTAAMHRKDYAAAEKLFEKGANVDQQRPDGVLLLRMAVAQDNQEKYAEALETATKAIIYTEAGSQEQEMAKQERARLQKILGSGPTGVAAPAPAEPSTDQPK